MDKQEIVIKEFNGVAIQIAEGKEVNLTNMWKASGSNQNQSPYKWSRQDSSTKFLHTLCGKLKRDSKSLLKTKKGRYFGGTWGHWQIA